MTSLFDTSQSPPKGKFFSFRLDRDVSRDLFFPISPALDSAMSTASTSARLVLNEDPMASPSESQMIGSIGQPSFADDYVEHTRVSFRNRLLSKRKPKTTDSGIRMRAIVVEQAWSEVIFTSAPDEEEGATYYDDEACSFEEGEYARELEMMHDRTLTFVPEAESECNWEVPERDSQEISRAVDTVRKSLIADLDAAPTVAVISESDEVDETDSKVGMQCELVPVRVPSAGYLERHAERILGPFVDPDAIDALEVEQWDDCTREVIIEFVCYDAMDASQILYGPIVLRQLTTRGATRCTPVSALMSRRIRRQQTQFAESAKRYERKEESNGLPRDLNNFCTSPAEEQQGPAFDWSSIDPAILEDEEDVLSQWSDTDDEDGGIELPASESYRPETSFLWEDPSDLVSLKQSWEANVSWDDLEDALEELDAQLMIHSPEAYNALRGIFQRTIDSVQAVQDDYADSAKSVDNVDAEHYQELDVNDDAIRVEPVDITDPQEESSFRCHLKEAEIDLHLPTIRLLQSELACLKDDISRTHTYLSSLGAELASRLANVARLRDEIAEQKKAMASHGADSCHFHQEIEANYFLSRIWHVEFQLPFVLDWEEQELLDSVPESLQEDSEIEEQAVFFFEDFLANDVDALSNEAPNPIITLTDYDTGETFYLWLATSHDQIPSIVLWEWDEELKCCQHSSEPLQEEYIYVDWYYNIDTKSFFSTGLGAWLTSGDHIEANTLNTRMPPPRIEITYVDAVDGLPDLPGGLDDGRIHGLIENNREAREETIEVFFEPDATECQVGEPFCGMVDAMDPEQLAESMQIAGSAIQYLDSHDPESPLRAQLWELREKLLNRSHAAYDTWQSGYDDSQCLSELSEEIPYEYESGLELWQPSNIDDAMRQINYFHGTDTTRPENIAFLNDCKSDWKTMAKGKFARWAQGESPPDEYDNDYGMLTRAHKANAAVFEAQETLIDNIRVAQTHYNACIMSGQFERVDDLAEIVSEENLDAPSGLGHLKMWDACQMLFNFYKVLCSRGPFYVMSVSTEIDADTVRSTRKVCEMANTMKQWLAQSKIMAARRANESTSEDRAAAIHVPRVQKTVSRFWDTAVTCMQEVENAHHAVRESLAHHTACKAALNIWFLGVNEMWEEAQMAEQLGSEVDVTFTLSVYDFWVASLEWWDAKFEDWLNFQQREAVRDMWI